MSELERITPIALSSHSERMHNLYIGMAELCSAMSRARRLQVGAIIVKDDNVISFGWNGMPSGWNNDCEFELPDGALKTNPEVLHAEMNALAKLSRSTQSGLSSTMYCTHAACMECAKLIYQSGVSKVYYRHDYRDAYGIDFLRKCNVTVTQI